MAYDGYPKSINTQEVQEYLDDEFIDNEWGTTVKYELTKNGYTVVSAGPDKIFGTIDDMRLTAGNGPKR